MSIIRLTHNNDADAANQPPCSIHHLAQTLDLYRHAVIAFDANGPIICLNHSAEMLLGYRTEEVAGLPLQCLLKPCRRESFPNTFESETVEYFYAHTRHGINIQLTSRIGFIETDVGPIMLANLGERHETAYTTLAMQRRIAELERENSRLQELVNTDPLTGLLNRRGIETALARELAVAKRTQGELLAALVDLDDFKRINDLYGHHVGDEVLCRTARAMQDYVRVSDWLARIGGDEFLILLPGTSLTSGVTVADRVRIKVAETANSPRGAGNCSVSVSVGIACLSSDIGSLEDILKLTQSSIKASKAGGKNRVSVWNGSEVVPAATFNAYVVDNLTYVNPPSITTIEVA